MPNPDKQSLKIAIALEKLVDDGIAQIETSMNVLDVPASVRAPMWEAVCRRAMAKVIACEQEAPNAHP